VLKVISERVKVSDITRLYVRDKVNLEALQRAIEVEALAEDWRSYSDKVVEPETSKKI
jgi:hypothetical protein